MSDGETGGNRANPVEPVEMLLRRQAGRVHCVGICGIGMAGVAALLRSRGLRVTGCDVKPQPLADWLAGQGIAVAAGHDPAHAAEGADWIVRSSAISTGAPEIQAALARGLPVFRRGEVLAALLEGAVSIAVGGTHGKTTTASLIAQVLKSAGRDPSFCIGGEVPALGGVAAAGGGPHCVVEADESDGTLALYRPDIAVVTNIEFDHMEHFAGVAEFEACFRTFMAQTRRRVIYCADDPRAARLGAASSRGLAYGLAESAALRAEAVRPRGDGCRYRLLREGAPAGDIELPLPGRHNVLNSLAVIAAGLEIGLTLDEIRRGLAHAELPRRRFERIVTRADIAVVSDYGHHPTEIGALVRTARDQGRARIVAVFQPHRYTRTKALGEDFPAAFAGVSELVLTPVYAASEAPLPGGTIWDLYAHFRRAAVCDTIVAESLNRAWDYLCVRLRPGDLLLVVGAGDVEQIAVRARQALDNGQPLAGLDPAPRLAAAVRALALHATEVRVREPLAEKTTLGVGGAADVWADIGSEADLAELLRWCRATGTPWRLMGAGSNLLIGDAGVRGIVIRLAGPAFRRLAAGEDGVVAGAGAPLGALLRWAREQQRGGVEYLQGIPGTLGGGLRMNAGAWGGQLGDCVQWVRGLDGDGQAVRLERRELDFGYRACPALDGIVVLEAGLALAAGDADAMRRHCAAYAARREWLRGLRTAGSVFKNPGGDHAGRLIESAGLKGTAIGGAAISTRHANVIVATAGARGSDVRALMEKTRIDVEARFGVKLAPEIVYWD